MANLQSIENHIQAISSAFEQLEQGKLTQEELEMLVEHTRELYERAVVLRYKAFEEKIFGETKTIIPETEGIQQEEPEFTPEQETQADEISEVIFSEPEPVAKEEQPVFDFSLFDEPETPTSVTEEVQEVSVSKMIEPIEEESIEAAEISVEEEPVKEKPVAEGKSEPIVATPSFTASANPKFISKFSKTEPDELIQIRLSKLATLSGSFGLNERLLFINELFDGSSDAFSEAVLSLDRMTNMESALEKMAAYSVNYHWDPESDTVSEFVMKIKRRFI